MSKLTDGYDMIITAIEDWLYVVEKKMLTDTDMTLLLLYQNLSILRSAHVVARPQVDELEKVLKELGLEPRSIDTASLDALWGDDNEIA